MVSGINTLSIYTRYVKKNLGKPSDIDADRLKEEHDRLKDEN